MSDEKNREEILPDPRGSEKRRFSQRLEVRDRAIETVLSFKGEEFPARVVDMSALGFLVDFGEKVPPILAGMEASILLSVGDAKFKLKGVVRRVEGTEAALWLPEVVSGQGNDGMRLQDLILKIAAQTDD